MRRLLNSLQKTKEEEKGKSVIRPQTFSLHLELVQFVGLSHLTSPSSSHDLLDKVMGPSRRERQGGYVGASRV